MGFDNKRYIDNRYLRHFIAGGLSAAMAETVLAPMERVKIILQVQRVTKQIPKDKLYKGMFDAFFRIIREQGLLSFWRGHMSNVLRYFPAQALNFTFKPLYKSYFLEGVNQKTHFWRYFAGNLASGGSAGATSMCVIYPMDFVRTRLAADIGKGKDRMFRGIVDCLVKTVNSDGPRGLYRGFLVSVQGIFIYRAIYFGCYDTARSFLPHPKETPLFISWAIAHAVTMLAVTVTYPMDTVRRLMMMQSGLRPEKRMYTSTADCWSKIYRTEGIRTLYRGLVTSLFSCSSGSFVLVFYHEIKKLM